MLPTHPTQPTTHQFCKRAQHSKVEPQDAPANVSMCAMHLLAFMCIVKTLSVHNQIMLCVDVSLCGMTCGIASSGVLASTTVLLGVALVEKAEPSLLTLPGTIFLAAWYIRQEAQLQYMHIALCQEVMFVCLNRSRHQPHM